MSLLLAILAIILLLWCALLYIRFPAPLGFLVIFPKLAAGAWAPFLAIAAALLSLVAGILRAPVPAVAGGLAALGFAFAFHRLTAAFDGATVAFGAEWEQLLPAEKRAGMLPHRWVGRLPGSPEPRWRRNLPFWTIPGTDRALLCDLWQPPAGVQPSGLAYLYFHGSAWYIFDKDMGTRQLFRHLAAQGHVVMDVAYRLFPETDVAGMAGDVKRAIAWVKEHAAELGVDPARIVIGGSSAGGHLAQLVGYAPNHPDLTPADVAGADLSVAGVVSCYGPSDLRVCYQHTNQHKTTKPTDRMPDFAPPAKPSPLLERLFGPGTQRLGLH
ncbi:MAG TPA: alpha/beta hydrolase, partial [Symbiobacteriaceae bacterium]|nr:alpha/beta hydrolase [Symbiobacteriaceae bacterium]